MDEIIFVIILLLLVPFVLIIILLAKVSSINNKLDVLSRKVTSVIDTSTISPPPAEVKKKPLPTPPISTPKAPPVVEKKEITPIPPKPKPQPELVKSIAYSKTPVAKAVPPMKKAAPKPSFWERNPDLEKFIGENLLSKIGIVIFVIGMGFLVKLGIDNNVITESMRVAIGVVIGGAMVGLAHYLRKKFSKFSSILIGGALSVLYFTIALAFHQYQLISQSAAFIVMVFITAFGVLLSLAYDRKELAVLAMLGGFGTPFFVSTGAGSYQVLLTYILILDIGMLALVYFKKWNIINYLTYGFTYVLFVGVFVTEFFDNIEATRMPLFLFLTAFYLIFFLMSVVYNVKNKRKFAFPEIGMLLTNSSMYFGFGLALVNSYKSGLYSGLFTGLIAVFNFMFTYLLYKRKDIDKNLIFLLIGLVLTFVSLTAPIQLEGNFITLFWAMESLLLFWLSQKSGIKLMKLTSIIVLGLMVISLLMDWQQNYTPIGDFVILNLFLNKAFITTLVATASLVAISKLTNGNEPLNVIGISLKTAVFNFSAAAIFYIGLLLELNYQFIKYEFADSLRLILLGIYNYIFVIALAMAQRYKASNLLKGVVLVTSSLSVFAYLTYYLAQIVDARNALFLGESTTGYYWHYLLLALFVMIVINLYKLIHKTKNIRSGFGKISLGILAFVSVFVASAEFGHISVLYQSTSQSSHYMAYSIAVKSIFPVVWAITALIFMIVGMRFKLKTLRIASLVVFSITIAKLFLYDLQGNATGKIVSFIVLGIILLVISFLYQKLKFIIQDDSQSESSLYDGSKNDHDEK